MAAIVFLLKCLYGLEEHYQLKLGVAIRVRRAFLGLAVGLQAVARPLQQGSNGAIRHAMVLPSKLFGQLVGALARPAQGGFRMAPGCGIDQRIQGLLQSRIGLRQGLTTATRIANPDRDSVIRVGLAMRQFANARHDRIASQARGGRDHRDAAPAHGGCFSGGPLSQGQRTLSKSGDLGKLVP